MKKTSLCFLCMFVLIFNAGAQVNVEVSSAKAASTPTPVLIVDTLHYYLNKHYFKTANTDLETYSSYITNATGVISSTAITFCGSKFEVPPGETVLVTGVEAFVKKAASTVNLSVPIHLYLFNVNPSTGLPVMPAIDSVVSAINTKTISLIGGNFTNTATFAARTMTASYAVGLRNMSGNSGDFVHLIRTAGVTETSTPGPALEKYSDGFGFVRHNGQFYSTTNFSLMPGFGTGTDYEFMVAPRVTYTIQASHLLPQGVISADDLAGVPDTMCTRTTITFTNTSSKFYEHRQYNLNQFYRKWNLYSPFPLSVAGTFSKDSSLTWNFEFYDASLIESRVFLPYVNSGTISAITGLAYYPNCFTDNEFRARYRPMGALGRVPQKIYNIGFKVCFRYCNGDTVGITTVKGYEDFKAYPNPAASGKTLLSGLEGKTTVTVYNALGELIFTKITESNVLEIDLSKEAKGTYLLRILNGYNQAKIVKILNQE